MRTPENQLEYNQIQDAMKIVIKKRYSTWRWIAQYVCCEYPHIVFECGWDESIIEEIPDHQCLGIDICEWCENILGFENESLTNSEFGWGCDEIT